MSSGQAAPRTSTPGALAAVITVAALYATIFTVPPLIAPIFHDELGLSFADAGLLMTVYLAAYAAVSLPAAGQYYVRVSGSTTNVQLYQLQLSVQSAVVAQPGDFDGDGDGDGNDLLV